VYYKEEGGREEQKDRDICLLFFTTQRKVEEAAYRLISLVLRSWYSYEGNIT